MLLGIVGLICHICTVLAKYIAQGDFSFVMKKSIYARNTTWQIGESFLFIFYSMDYTMRPMGYWDMGGLNASFDVNGTTGQDVGYDVKFTATPMTFSYHCSDAGGMSMLPNQTISGDMLSLLKFNEFQVGK